ncbi:hypothetical protein KC340_g59 [Hortaea werneckii]|nr:hypothetical protein KC340_g59 [Hortaea werneckii]
MLGGARCGAVAWLSMFESGFCSSSWLKTMSGPSAARMIAVGRIVVTVCVVLATLICWSFGILSACKYEAQKHCRINRKESVRVFWDSVACIGWLMQPIRAVSVTTTRTVAVESGRIVGNVSRSETLCDSGDSGPKNGPKLREGRIGGSGVMVPVEAPSF